jgi:alpha-galactosidase
MPVKPSPRPPTVPLVKALRKLGIFARNIQNFSALPQAVPAAVKASEDGLCWKEQNSQGMSALCRLVPLVSAGVAQLEVEIFNDLREPTGVYDGRWFCFDLSERKQKYRSLRMSGGLADGHYPPENFRTQEVRIASSLINRSPATGRSSDGQFPITILADDDGSGMWFGIEWSGEWQHMLFSRGHGSATSLDDAGLQMYLQLRQVRFALEPGERLSLPPVFFGFFEGGVAGGASHFKKFLRDQVCPRFPGTGGLPPVSYDHWFGIMENYNADFLCRQADRAAELGVEYFVIDAAWHSGGFPGGAGNWEEPDPQKFPQGLKPVMDYVRSREMAPGLWFDIERARRDSTWVRRHPDYFIDIGECDMHLNLALPEAQDFVLQFLDRLIEELGLRWIRWDYNINPSPYWKAADPSGKIQFSYMKGLYRIFDSLREKHPLLVLENCASGGRRIDLGTLRRTHICWFSDETASPEICRFMQLQANVFLPGRICNSGIITFLGQGNPQLGMNELPARAAGSLSLNGDIASWSAQFTREMAKSIRQYKAVRHLLDQRYFRLLPSPSTLEDWDAGLFLSENGLEGLLFVFRYEGEGKEVMRSSHLLPGKYHLRPLYAPGRPLEITGKEFSKNGLSLRLPANSGKIWHLTYCEHP